MVDGDGLIVGGDALPAVDLEHPPVLTGRTDPVLGACAYDFYRCQRCQRLVTAPQLARALQRTDKLEICPCGGLKISPTNPLWWELCFLPRVWVFAWQRAGERLTAERKAAGLE